MLMPLVGLMTIIIGGYLLLAAFMSLELRPFGRVVAIAASACVIASGIHAMFAVVICL